MDERAIEIGRRLLAGYDLADAAAIVDDADYLFMLYDAEVAHSGRAESQVEAARAEVARLEEQVAELQRRLGE